MGNSLRCGDLSAPAAEDHCVEGLRCRHLLPPVAEDHDGEALVLVVGNDTVSKARFAQELAVARGADPTPKQTAAGVRIYTRGSLPVVVDTVPLRTVDNWTMVDTARTWISQNSLRKLAGKLVFVVCIVTCPDPNDRIYREKDLLRKRFSWLHLLGCVCGEKKAQVMMVVNFDDMTNEASMTRIKGVLVRDGFTRNANVRSHTSFVPLRAGDLRPTIDYVLTRSVHRREADDGIAAPFVLEEVGPNAAYDEKCGSWGPQAVILFGRTGSGKSSFAQMLTSGRLDPHSTNFPSCSGCRGKTNKVHCGQGRGWYVVDTPGLGESQNDPWSTVAEVEAKRMIEHHVSLVDGTFCHFFYVWKKDRLDLLDEKLWKVFVETFGEEKVRKYMTVVVSGADQGWLRSNMNDLTTMFKGCESFLPAEFPWTGSDDEDLEREEEEARTKSLEDVEDQLASLCRVDRPCRLGRWSLSTQYSQLTRADVPLFPPVFRGNSESSAPLPDPIEFAAARFFMRLKSMMSNLSRLGRRQQSSAGMSLV